MLAAELVNELVEAADEKQLTRSLPPRLCPAIVDQLPSNGAIIQTEADDSYRLVHTKAQAEQAEANGVSA
ncbi:hypothetical protein DSC45_20945 [Streptomyces sp. YIM 130001]|nr:hypothetical protein DSC45_20945 [Streptomyces sp. YIM 130001]